MRVFTLEPDESWVWKLRLGHRGLLIADIEASVAIDTYVFDAADYDDDDDDYEELPYFERHLRRLEHNYRVRLTPGSRVVVVASNIGSSTAAVYARVGSK